MSGKMRKIFIDGGAHKGESVDLFYKLYPDAKEYEIHSFEPNPDMWELLEKKQTILHKEALWGSNTERDYFKGKNSEGGTIMLEKVSGKINYNKSFPTKCVRLSDWIRDNFNKDDYIILKLDIEGAEYSVLNDMIDTGMIHWLNELLGELHGTGPTGRIRSLPVECYHDLLKRLSRIDIKLKDWNDNVLGGRY